MRTTSPRFARYAWATLAFTVLVILWGAFVRATGSGAGCGSHWPLCNGEIVPQAPALATLIEFGHRLTSGAALLLVIGLVIGARRSFAEGHPARLGAYLSLFFMVTEALIGAGLVLLEYVADDVSLARGFWMAGHLVNTFLLVAVMTLCAWWGGGGGMPSLEGRTSLAIVLGLTIVAMLLLGVSGAVTALGDTLFPAASLAEAKEQTWSASSHLFVRLRIWHPGIAIVVGLWVVAASVFAVSARPTPEVRRLARILTRLYAVQGLVGVLDVWLLAPISLQLLHLLLADLVWIALVLLSATALERAPALAAVAEARAAAGSRA